MRTLRRIGLILVGSGLVTLMIQGSAEAARF